MNKAALDKGVKCNLQFPTAERLYYEQECGFTDEELEILELRAKGKTVLQISFIMSDRHGRELSTGYYTVSKVEARIRSIKAKIRHLIQ